MVNNNKLTEKQTAKPDPREFFVQLHPSLDIIAYVRVIFEYITIFETIIQGTNFENKRETIT